MVHTRSDEKCNDGLVGLMNSLLSGWVWFEQRGSSLLEGYMVRGRKCVDDPNGLHHRKTVVGPTNRKPCRVRSFASATDSLDWLGGFPSASRIGY